MALVPSPKKNPGCLGMTVAIVGLAIAVPAFAAKQYFDLQANEGQRSHFEQGIEAIDSDLPHSSARLFEPEEQAKKRVALRLECFNAGDVPFNIGPENVTVETAQGEAVAVIPYERLVKEEKHRQFWMAFAAGLAAAGNSISAANAGYSSGSFSAYGNRGWVNGTYSNYNGGQAYLAQSVANSQNAAMFDRLGATDAERMQALSVNMRTTTVDPGHGFGGQIILELPSDVRKSKAPADLIVHVHLGADVHSFHARIVRR